MTYGKAPYNFIPLSKKPKTVRKDTVEKHNIQSKGNYTGYLEYKVTTKSPTFIGSTVVEKEDDFDIVRPFEIHGKPAIPGSSFRGMITQLMEILSKSPMKQFDDRRLYFRDVASNSNLSSDYQDQISDIKKGLLFKKGNTHFIRPVNSDDIGNEPYNIDKKEEKDNTFFKDGNIIKWRTGLMYKKLGRKPDGLYCGEYIFDLSTANDKIEVPKNVYEQFHFDEAEYKTDAQRIEYTNKSSDETKLYIEWIDYFSSNSHNNDKKGVPVFYTLDEDGNVYSIGHTKYHRIPHKNSIGDTLPDGHKDIDEGALGMVEAMMGNKEDFASRLRFTDATMTVDEDNPYLEQGIMKKLMNPKPTAFPFYLKQDNTDPQKQSNYSSDNPELRGRKMYWNKNNVDWQDTEQSAEHKFQKKIKPIKKGVEFTGKIHFNNLTKKELGLLLFSLKLDQDMYHRIGMGKPYGMGKVEVSITDLRKIKNKNRYLLLKDKYKDGVSGKLKRSVFLKKFLKDELSVDKNLKVKYLVSRFFNRPDYFSLMAMLSDPLNTEDWDEKHSYIEFDTDDKNKMKEFNKPLIPEYTTKNTVLLDVSRADIKQDNNRYKAILKPSDEEIQIPFKIEDNIAGMSGVVYYIGQNISTLYVNNRFYDNN